MGETGATDWSFAKASDSHPTGSICGNACLDGKKPSVADLLSGALPRMDHLDIDNALRFFKRLIPYDLSFHRKFHGRFLIEEAEARALKLSSDRIDPVSASVALESIHPAHEGAHRTICKRKRQSPNQGRLFNFKGLRLDLARIQDRISIKNKDECSQSIDGCSIRTRGGLPCHPLFGDCFLPVMGTGHLHRGKLDRLFGR